MKHVSVVVNVVLENILNESKSKLLKLFKKHKGNIADMAKDADVSEQEVIDSLEFHDIPIHIQ